MRKYLLLLLFINYCTSSYSQTVDLKLMSLINERDWFTLDEEYPKLKDSIKSNYLGELAEALLLHEFNHPKEAIEKFRHCINNYQKEFTSSTMNYVASVLYDYGRIGEYRIAAEKAKSVYDQMSNQETDSTSSFWTVYLNNNMALAQFSPPQIIKKDNDTIPFMSSDKVFVEGLIPALIYLPITYHGKTFNFILDSGAPKTTIFRDDFLQEFGLDYIGDIKYGNDSLVYIDSLIIGKNIIYKNIIALIFNSGDQEKLKQNQSYKIDGVIGMDFISMIGEFCIDYENDRIIFPKQESSMPQFGRNIRIDSEKECIYVKAKDSRGPLMTTLDIGCATSVFYYKYFVRYRDVFSNITDKKEIVRMAPNIVYKDKVIIAPNITLECSGKVVNMENIDIPCEKNSVFVRDNEIMFGQSLFRPFGKVTINTNKMFLKLGD